jgi:hypothetical protein
MTHVPFDSMKGRVLVACWMAFLAPTVRAGESVLYSITDKSVVYPMTNRPISASTDEYKTDIFAVDSETRRKRLQFWTRMPVPSLMTTKAPAFNLERVAGAFDSAYWIVGWNTNRFA